MHRKIYYREFYYNINIIEMFMNNVIILLLAVRICEDSDNGGSDKRGFTTIITTSISSVLVHYPCAQASRVM